MYWGHTVVSVLVRESGMTQEPLAVADPEGFATPKMGVRIKNHY
jgi:hypothetical protein